MIDVIRTSASRPDLLEKSTESFNKFVKYSGGLRVLFHEDMLNRPESKKCLQIAERFKFNDIYSHYPPITQGPSLDFLLRKTETTYVLNFEDDWEALREIDLDLAVKIMEENPDVNQIAYHKRKTMADRAGWVKKVVERSGIKLTTNPHWAFTPALWRRDFIMKYWKTPPAEENPVWFINPLVKRRRGMPDADYMIKHVGAYFMGPIREPAFIWHLGFQNSVREGERKF